MNTRGEFIPTSLIGIVVAVIGTWWTIQSHSGAPKSFLEAVGVFFVYFCVPFGWKFFTYLQSFVPVTLFGTWWFWFVYFVVKLVASILAGIPAFIYQLVKTILTQKKINKLK